MLLSHLIAWAERRSDFRIFHGSAEFDLSQHLIGKACRHHEEGCPVAHPRLPDAPQPKDDALSIRTGPLGVVRLIFLI